MFSNNFFKRLIFILAFCVTTPLLASDWLYTVRPNDDASNIGNKYLVNPYRIDEVLKYNSIDEGKGLLPGTVLKIPLNMLKFGPARVQVITVQGTVSIERASKLEKLSTVHSIQFGDKIITGDDSSVMMRFADKSELLLGSDSVLIFDVLTQWGRTGMVDSRMRLMQGSVEGRVETLDGPGAHFEVHTPSAVATVRGTEFRVRVNSNNTEVTYNEVSEGKVQVDNKVSPVLIPQGFGIVSEKGKAADKPIQLLPAPTLTQARNEYPAKPVTIDWQNFDQATAYRVELFADEAFKERLQSFTTESNKVAFNTIETGEYSVRIRAIDANGLEGLDTRHSFKLNGAPIAPTHLTAKNDLLVGEKIALQWNPSESAESYLLEVSDTDTFETLIAKDKTENSQLEINELLAEGEYFWRVIAINKYGKGYPSEIKNLSVVIAEKPVLLSATDMEVGSKFIAKSSEVPYATSYQWQLASDEDFNNIVAAEETKTSELTIDGLSIGDYYVRVAANAPKNNNRFSEPKKFEVFEEGNGKNPFMLSSLLLILLVL